MDSRLEKIHIRDLMLRCIVGINDWEREKKQDVLINITLYADLKTACQTDRIEDTVDYKAIKQKVVDMVEASSYMLVERLAEEVANICRPVRPSGCRLRRNRLRLNNMKERQKTSRGGRNLATCSFEHSWGIRSC